MSGKTHLSIVIAGHVDSGKSTTTGRLLFELGGIPQREMDKLKQEAETLGKSSFAFAFYMDKSKEERARGVTIQCTTKEFFTDRYHYTIIDAPGHRDFIKNMISGSSQADVGLLMVPADGNFTTAIAKGSHKEGEIQGQTRQHARLLNLLGVKQLIVGVNKMDSDTAKYSEERYREIRDEMKLMLLRVGWNKKFVEENVIFMPISGWKGDNLINKSENMAWWNGVDAITINGNKVHVNTLSEALNNYVEPPVRNPDAPMRMPVGSVHKIKGVGDVITGRIEQGTLKPESQVVFHPSHTTGKTCGGKVFSIEMHHNQIPEALPGYNVGLNIKGLQQKPNVGDVMVLAKDTTLKPVTEFTAAVQTLEIPNEIKVGYCPIVHVRTGHCACKIVAINWKMGKETNNQKVENPSSLKTNEMAEVVFKPTKPFVCEAFKDCESLGRMAALDGNSAILLGKILKIS